MPEETAIARTALNLEKIQQLEKRQFLLAYSRVGNISWAAEQVGITRYSHYEWLKADGDYGAAFDEAVEMAKDALEREAHRRAVEGNDDKELTVEDVEVGKDGKPTGRTKKLKTVHRLSDTLLIFLLKAARPHKFRERYEITGAGGGPIQVAHTVYRLEFDGPARVGDMIDVTATPAPPLLESVKQDTLTPNNGNGHGNGHGNNGHEPGAPAGDAGASAPGHA